jgi:hypothetical protein
MRSGAAFGGSGKGDPPAVLSGGKGPDRYCGSARRGRHRRVCAARKGSTRTSTTAGSKDFLEAGKKRLLGDTARETTRDEATFPLERYLQRRQRGRQRREGCRARQSAWPQVCSAPKSREGPGRMCATVRLYAPSLSPSGYNDGHGRQAFAVVE